MSKFDAFACGAASCTRPGCKRQATIAMSAGGVDQIEVYACAYDRAWLEKFVVDPRCKRGFMRDNKAADVRSVWGTFGRRRGTSNGNNRSNSRARRARKLWLLKTYAARPNPKSPEGDFLLIDMLSWPVCRCYACGVLLTFKTLTVDRIVPGSRGGTYARNNIRPACASCNSATAHLARN